MSRRKSLNLKRDVGVDPLYGEEIVQKFINVVMWRGKKDTARRLVYKAIKIISGSFGNDEIAAVDVFKNAVRNCTPAIEVKARRVGGSVYQVPSEVSGARGRAIAFRNIISAASSRSGKDFAIRLSGEILDANESRGGAFKAKSDKHKMAESNRAFSHLVW